MRNVFRNDPQEGPFPAREVRVINWPDGQELMQGQAFHICLKRTPKREDAGDEWN